jgi:hypothetical protein
MSSLSVDKGTDPTLVVAAYKKNRFYLFSCRSPRDLSSVDNDRDVFNEKPSKEDIISATEEKGAPRLYQSATIHTTVGDIHLELFPKVKDMNRYGSSCALFWYLLQGVDPPPPL